MKNLQKRISVNSNICHGKPCIKGHRIMVYQILNLLETGHSFEEIIRNHFPQITKEDIQACIHYANSIVQNEEIHYYEESRKS